MPKISWPRPTTTTKTTTTTTTTATTTTTTNEKLPASPTNFENVIPTAFLIKRMQNKWNIWVSKILSGANFLPGQV